MSDVSNADLHEALLAILGHVETMNFNISCIMYIQQYQAHLITIDEFNERIAGLTKAIDESMQE